MLCCAQGLAKGGAQAETVVQAGEAAYEQGRLPIELTVLCAAAAHREYFQLHYTLDLTKPEHEEERWLVLASNALPRGHTAAEAEGRTAALAAMERLAYRKPAGDKRMQPVAKAALKLLLPEAKKAVATRGALTAAIIEVLMHELAFALNMHRGCGDGAKLKAALLNVIDHAFGRHDNCLKFFDCPNARGAGPARPKASEPRRAGSSFNAAGEWLGELPGGAEVEAVLRREWEARLTSDEKLELCKRLGADEVINYSTHDLRTELKKIKGGVDVVYDSIGDKYAEPCVRSMAWGGRYLVIGFA